MNLTEKQERFCQEYIKLGNKSDAYRIAYNTEKMKSTTINNKSYELFKTDKISARIGLLQEKVEEKHDVSKDWIINQLKNIIAKSSQAEMITDSQGGNSGEFKYDSSGVNKALDTLNKMMGYYAAEKREHSGELAVKSGMGELYKVTK